MLAPRTPTRLVRALARRLPAGDEHGEGGAAVRRAVLQSVSAQALRWDEITCERAVEVDAAFFASPA
jgi:hypothetical protein